ncbi:LamG-like jellyroll fold domain-containing protein [Natronoflexus pectinivorans]|uniref:Putative secreted protein (Por secretion system target) n=1 Tax=Natronoflexus pectinivorans TaxID=682526 RepID=A0A4R2GJC6_9BACT|nr:LamG-like jellyroll fold domain-containing protein [Natronoflexus pectinivorans]TCO08422.1 putative secreted protein (Por secretion system target) [Natronoflexus pectinivorans]
MKKKTLHLRLLSVSLLTLCLNAFSINAETTASNHALKLLGGNGSESHINIPEIPLTSNSFTMEMWFKPEGIQPNNAGLIYSRIGEHHAGIAYASAWQGTGKLRFMTNIATDDYGTVSEQIATPGEWHHIAVVLTPTSSTLYLNGTESQRDIVSPVYDFSTGNLYIGWDNADANRAFKGVIDEIRIWDTPKSSEEIIEKMYITLDGTEDNLIAYYNFDDANDGIATDMSGNGNNGLIVGGVYTNNSSYLATLSELIIDGINMYPPFKNGHLEYNIILPEETTSLNINAVTDIPGATVQGSGAVSLTDDEKSIIVEVLSADEKSISQYIIYIANTEPTLKHSYTFVDGTARDMVGDGDGTIIGGEIYRGVYTSSQDGHHITFPANKIAINSYKSITVELYVKAGNEANGNNHMLTYFGATQDGWKGVDYFFTSLKSRTAISCGNYGAPWGAENGVDSEKLDAGGYHHLVSILTNESISWYVDGEYKGSAALSEENKIHNLSTQFAYLCRAGYSDPTWIGSIYEYNIYSGVMGSQEIATRATDFPFFVSSDATLFDLKVDDITIDNFDANTLEYTMVLTTDISESPEVTAIASDEPYANVVVTNANQIPGTTTIEVTAEDGTKSTYTINFIYDTQTSFEQEKISSVIVYPTITDNGFYVILNNEFVAVRVFDITGTLIKTAINPSESKMIPLPRPGVYIIQIESETLNKTFRILKTK